MTAADEILLSGAETKGGRLQRACLDLLREHDGAGTIPTNGRFVFYELTQRGEAFVWAKQNKSGNGLFTGLGYWTRAKAELCLLATRGRPERRAKDVRQVILSPVQEHSRKPDEAARRIQRLV